MAKKAKKSKKATKKVGKKTSGKPAKKAAKKATKKAKAKKARRTTMYSSAGKKLYAVRDNEGKFKDIQTYQRAHAQDIKRDSADEMAASDNQG